MNIEKYFVLFKYLLNLFGVNTFKDLQERLKIREKELIAMEEATL